jgi:micrococcal nuclease
VGPERLRRWVLLGLAGVAVGIWLTSGALDDDPAPTGGSLPSSGAVVSQVVDGDTIRLTDGRSVRLVQIDAPEVPAECFGREATAVLVELLPRDTAVRLEGDPELDDRDEHGRLLRYVVLDEAVVNVELVRRGAAVPYFFRKERGAHAGRLTAAVESARAAGRGMWGACPDARLDPYRGSLSGRA